MRIRNRLIRYFIAFCVFILLPLTVKAGEVPERRLTMTMNTDWGFYLGDKVSNGIDDSEYQAISLPHIMRLEPKHCGGNIIYQGIGWYKRYFRLDTRQKGKNVYLSFEGVMKNCQIFINGSYVGEHYGGYMGFEFEITPYIRWDESNLLEVRVSAEPDPLTPPGKAQEKMDFYYYSGIYRDVNLLYKNDLQITDPLLANTQASGGVFVTYPEVSKEHATVSVKTQIANKSQTPLSALLVQKLCDDKGKILAKSEKQIQLNGGEVKDCTQEISLFNPKLWHPYSPYLYTLRTEVLNDGKVADDECTAIGIHSIRHTKEAFFINGERLYLRGTNRHQCFPNVGDAASNSLQERDAVYIKKGGFNAVRAAHYPQDPAFLDACDKYGLLVIECIPGWQFWNDDQIFAERLFEVERQMIRRDRNHPSIILWETMMNESSYPQAIADSIQKIAHAEFPGDQMYTVGDYWGHKNMSQYFDVLYKQVSKFPSNGDVMLNILEDMINIAASYTREWGDGAGVKPRVSLKENEYEQLLQCYSRMEALNGKGYFDWCMLDANPTLSGHFSWSFMDYPRGLDKNTLFCGVVDLNRFPKFSYYMHQSMRDARISQRGLYSGPMVHIASYNSSAALESSAKEVWVFSNCDSVSLYRNGALISTLSKQKEAEKYQYITERGGSPAYRFCLPGYEAGTLCAVAYLDGKVSCWDEVCTATEPYQLKIVVPDCGINAIADGSDMIPVWIEVLDKAGNRVTDSGLKIHITVTGEGSLIGEDNDYACIEHQSVEGGVGACFVRTSKKAGRIVIKAEAAGVKPGQIVVKSRNTGIPAVKDGNHSAFSGKASSGKTGLLQEETHYTRRLFPTLIIPSCVSRESKYPVSNICDGDDDSWWISPSAELPQTLVLEFDSPQYVSMGRINFQKDSSTYGYRVEVSSDGNIWEELFSKESTGWDLRPFRIERKVLKFRITFLQVSEGNPGLAELSLYGP